jgi:hypothetical protein
VVQSNQQLARGIDNSNCRTKPGIHLCSNVGTQSGWPKNAETGEEEAKLSLLQVFTGVIFFVETCMVNCKTNYEVLKRIT